MDPYLLFAIFIAPAGAAFLVSWAVVMVAHRRDREPRPGSAVFSSFRRVILGRNLMTAMIIASYTCGIFIGPLLLVNTTTCVEAEFGF